MSHEGYRRAARACVAVVIFGALLVAAPAAWAGRISYNVLPGSGYTVKHEGRNGIVKVTYDTCLAAGQPTSFPLVVTASAWQTRAPIAGASPSTPHVLCGSFADTAWRTSAASWRMSSRLSSRFW